MTNHRISLLPALLFGLVIAFAAACDSDDSDDGTESASGTETSADSTEEEEGAEGDESAQTGDEAATEAGEGAGEGATEAGEAGESGEGADTSNRVRFTTNMGAFVIDLRPDVAPITVANFTAYVDSGFYDGSDGQGATLFHRVIPGFMAQGGGLTAGLQGKAPMAPIENESGNGLVNVRGTVAMARTSDPDSATAQFFVNVVDNPFLDEPPGYAVFGSVSEGMDVIDAMVAVQTTTVGQFQDVPVDDIVIESVEYVAE